MELLQELPMTIAAAPKVEDMEAMAHDFFTPQPLKRKFLRENMHHKLTPA